MSVGDLVEALAESRGVDKVAVVGHADAVGAVNVERLGFRIGAAASRGVAEVTEAHVARQISDASSVLKDLGGHAIALALVEASTRATAHDTSGILATMLKQIQSIVDLDGRGGRFGITVDNGDNSTHGEECDLLGDGEYNNLRKRVSCGFGAEKRIKVVGCSVGSESLCALIRMSQV